MKKFRMFALLLAVLLLTGVLAGCNPGGEDKSTTPVPGTSTKSPDGTTEPTTTADEKMNGYDFIWGHAGDAKGEGDTANDAAIREILAAVEERFDCTISFADPGNANNNLDELIASVVSGTKIADFTRSRQSSWIPLSIMGGLRAPDSAEMLAAGLETFNEDCFNQHYTQMTKLNGHVWGLDISGQYVRGMAFGHVYAFNKRLVEEAGYPADTLFDAVRKGTWDYTMFLKVARAITRDIDGDGAYDIWGVALDCDGNEIWTNGTGPITQDSTGRWISDLSDPRLILSLEFMTGVSGDPQVQMSLEGEAVPSRGARRTLFYEGKAGFAGLYGPNFAAGGTFDMADPVGLLPIPKGPNTDKYMLNMVNSNSEICLISNTDWEKSAKIMNELGRALYDTEGYREYLREAMQGDEQSLEMLETYLLPNAVMNIAKCSEEMYQLTRFSFYDAIYKGNMTPAAAAEAFQGPIQAELDKIFRQ